MRLIFGYLSVLLFAASGFALSAPERPNILFFFADDWGRFARIYAEHGDLAGTNGLLRTPNLDRLAKEGVLFRNAHVNAPSCTPCRSSLLSGQHFWRTGRGAILQGAVWDESIPTYPLLLRDAGYHLGKSYKVWSPGSPADAPYGGQQHAFEKSGRAFNNFSENATDLVAKGATVEAARAKLLEEVRGNFNAMLAAYEDNNPVLLFEHKALYRGAKAPVQFDADYRQVWQPRHVEAGDYATVVTYGQMVGLATEAAAYFRDEYELSFDLWDLRALNPMKLDAIKASLARTHRLIVLHEGRRTHGFGAELVAQLTEEHFFDLEAPPLRIGSLDLPVPFAPELEDAFRPNFDKITTAIANWIG